MPRIEFVPFNETPFKPQPAHKRLLTRNLPSFRRVDWLIWVTTHVTSYLRRLRAA